jgi:hypothetical protein
LREKKTTGRGVENFKGKSPLFEKQNTDTLPPQIEKQAYYIVCNKDREKTPNAPKEKKGRSHVFLSKNLWKNL